MFFKKIINLQYAVTYFFEKETCVSFIFNWFISLFYA